MEIWVISHFQHCNTVLIPYLDYMFGLQSYTKSLESNKTLFTLMGSHIHESENSINMSFNDITRPKDFYIDAGGNT